MTEAADRALEFLELVLADDFVRRATSLLRKLTDSEINEVFLITHAGPMMGDPTNSAMSVMMPVVEAEFDLRRRLQNVPEMGPVVAPELYAKGGGHDCPF